MHYFLVKLSRKCVGDFQYPVEIVVLSYGNNLLGVVVRDGDDYMLLNVFEQAFQQ